MAKKMTAAEKAERATRTTKSWAGGTFLLGALASVAANVVAAEPTVIGRVVSAWPAVALLLTVHLFQHAPRVWWIKIMVGCVAAVAGWVSYWHIVEVALRAGENLVSAHLMPVPVDAMMAVATAVLMAKPKPARRAPAKRAPAKAASSNVRTLKVAGR
jgi:hypothetical protein